METEEAERNMHYPKYKTVEIPLPSHTSLSCLPVSRPVCISDFILSGIEEEHVQSRHNGVLYLETVVNAGHALAVKTGVSHSQCWSIRSSFSVS